MEATYLTENQINEIMQWVIDSILIPHFMSKDLNASGEWVKNVGKRVEGDTGIITGRKYTEQLVFGRKPNSDQDHKSKAKWAYGMANFNPKFMNWLDIRGLKQYGFQIAYKIASEGTQIYKDGGTDLLEILQRPEVEVMIQERFAGYIRLNVELELKRIIKQNL